MSKLLLRRFLLVAAGESVLCIQEHSPIYRILSEDEATLKFLADWRYWCPQCQALTLSLQEAEEKLRQSRQQVFAERVSVGFLLSRSMKIVHENEQ